jgi:nucleotide-binding universal stress UspA family protein
MKFNKLIVAVSLEAETHVSLMKLKTMDIHLDTEIHLVHIVPVILYARGLHLSALTYPLMEERPKIEEPILAKLTNIKTEIFPNHKNVTFKCIFDANEKMAFCDYVEHQQADLIVVATRSKHGIANFFDSSFAQFQLGHSSTNILVLR